MGNNIKEFSKTLGSVKTASDLVKLRKKLSELNKLSWQLSQINSLAMVLKVLESHDPHATFQLEESLHADNKFALIISSEHRQLLKDLLKLFGAPTDTCKDIDQGVQFFEDSYDWGHSAVLSIRDFGDAIGLEYGEFFSVELSASSLVKLHKKIKAKAKSWQIN